MLDSLSHQWHLRLGPDQLSGVSYQLILKTLPSKLHLLPYQHPKQSKHHFCLSPRIWASTFLKPYLLMNPHLGIQKLKTNFLYHTSFLVPFPFYSSSKASASFPYTKCNNRPFVLSSIWYHRLRSTAICLQSLAQHCHSPSPKFVCYPYQDLARVNP